MKRPVCLSEPRNGVPDNLQRIMGIGERNEARLNQLGIFHFGQIAAWTPAEMRWIGAQLAFPERIERDDWVGQAIVLASGGDTGETKSADRRRDRRRGDHPQSGDDPHETGPNS
jgi:predicted flap endonuclease-1-like 5' DNA nuclease